MQLVRDWRRVAGSARGAVVALGNFDGVHHGHRTVIDAARQVALAEAAPLGVLTFEPHPRRFFRPDLPPFRVAPEHSKARLLRAQGAQFLYVLAFDQALANLDADGFVQQVLVEGLGVRHVAVGYDFVFGRGRSGDAALLRAAGARHGFGVTVVERVTQDGAVCSSTRIRECIATGAVDQAAALLGHWWEVEGFVVEGDQRGRQLGFPTANVELGDSILPRLGVYAVRAGIATPRGVDWRPAVANLGLRPTFGKDAVALEVHVLDYQGDLYGRRLRISFHGFIREERRFNGLDELKAQIAADRDRAAALLADPGAAPDRFGLPA